MKKVIVFFIFVVSFDLFSIEKPIIKFGSKSNNYFCYDAKNSLFYPSSISDNFYFYIFERINYHFSFKYKIEILYKNINKYTTNLDELRTIKLNNYLSFDIKINKNNSISIVTSPILDNYEGEFFFKNINKFSYSFKKDNFTFKTIYSNNYLLKKNEKFNHNGSFLFYFKFPKVDYIKYKCELSFYFEHYIYEYKEISPLKKMNFSFEVAIDFNKIDFETLFDNKNEEFDNFNEE